MCRKMHYLLIFMVKIVDISINKKYYKHMNKYSYVQTNDIDTNINIYCFE